MRVFLIAMLCLGLGACGGPVEDAKKLVAHDLKDPSSAQFRDVKKTGKAVCGEVNGKNAYGAYVGFKHFIVEGDTVTIQPDIPTERLSPTISPEGLAQWNAYTPFRGEWLAKCDSTLPALPTELQPDFPLSKH